MRGLLLLAELLAATGYAPKFLNRGVEELQGDTSSVVASFLIARHGTKVPAARNYSAFFGPGVRERLGEAGAFPELFAAGAAQEDALTRRFGAPPAALLPVALACEEAIGRRLRDAFGASAAAFAYSAPDKRTTATAAALLAGLGAKGAPVASADTYVLGEGDPLMDGCPRASESETERAVARELGATPAQVAERYGPQLSVLGAAAGADFRAEPLRWTGSEDGQPGGLYQTYSGGLATGCRLAEFFATEATAEGNGGPGGQPAAFRALGVDPANLTWLQQTCDAFYKFYKNRVNLRRFGGELAVHFLAALEQANTGTRSTLTTLEHDASKTTVVYAGHDVNVEFLRMLLGATWGSETGPLAPDAEPYSVAVLVQLLDRGDAEYWVRASVVAPSLAQRAAGCAVGLDTYPLKPACRNRAMDGSCTFKDFTALLRRSVEHSVCVACLSPAARTWWDEVGNPGRNAAAWMPVGVLTAMVLFGCIMYALCLRPSARDVSPTEEVLVEAVHARPRAVSGERRAAERG